MSLLYAALHGRRALGRTLFAAVNQQSRAIGGSAGAGQAAAAAAAAAAQPQPVVDEPASTSSSSPSDASSLPRWRRELGVVRNDWTREEVTEVYNTPLMELVYQAATVHRMYNDPAMVQRCTLLSIKTGGCPEDCGYCSQSSKWSSETGTKAERLMDLEPVYEAALRAREAGSTRFCMGAAWRGPSQVGPRQWERVLEMVRRIRGLGMEVCTTLGMLTPEQAKQLREAGLTAYNHNLDTSPEYYGQITTTRKYEDRLETLENVRSAGISVCAGGIIGLGEGEKDRVGLLLQLATLPAHPESVPINRLVAVKGTPIAAKQQEKKQQQQQQAEAAAAAAAAAKPDGSRAAAAAALGLPADDPEDGDGTPTGLDLVRCVATARVVMPRTVVRLSAGRMGLTVADQALAFFAGANSIFDGDKLLTTANNDRGEDARMFDALGLRSRPAFMPYGSGGESSRAFGEPVGADEAAKVLARAREEDAAARAEAGGGGGGGCCGKKSHQHQHA